MFLRPINPPLKKTVENLSSSGEVGNLVRLQVAVQPADAETLLFENALQESKDQIYRSPGKGREETVMWLFFSKEQEVIYKQYKFGNTNGLTHSNQLEMYGCSFDF